MLDWFIQESRAILASIIAIVVNPALRTYWPHLVLSFLLAIAAIKWGTAGPVKGDRSFGSACRSIFDRTIWFHHSAIIDYVCCVINAILRNILRFSMFVTGALSSFLLYETLVRINGGSPMSLSTGAVALAIYTIASLIWLDFGSFLSHYLTHRIPILWEFHKVHHSAQVLTPLTVSRVHPCDFIFLSFMSGLFLGSTNAVGLFAFGSKVEPFQILGISAGLFLFNALGANLRHSHIWLPYPHWLSRILISPAQHQIHHSALPKHHDANFGVIFAIWDWVFGTLYIPKGREPLTLGLYQGEDRDYQTVDALYFLPFQKAWARICGRNAARVEDP